MATHGSSGLFDAPRLSWSLLSTIPKKRLISIARQLGIYDTGMSRSDPISRALPLLRFEKDIVGELTVDELNKVARQLGVTLDSRRKDDIVRQLLKRERIGSVLRKYDGLPDELKDKSNRDLRSWAEYYLRSAEDDDCICDFEEPWVDESSWPLQESTIRLVSDLWPMADWSHWLAWQLYDGPAGKGPWWIFNFILPDKWYPGQLFLQKSAVWEFAFSWLYAASGPWLQFEVWKDKGKRITEVEHKWLAGAILDGILWDYDESEFVLACEKTPEIMYVEIYPPSDAKEHPEDDKPGKDGICWRK